MLTAEENLVKRMHSRTEGNGAESSTRTQLEAIIKWLELSEMEALGCTIFSIGLVVPEKLDLYIDL